MKIKIFFILFLTIGAIYCSSEPNEEELKISRLLEWIAPGSTSIVGIKSYGDWGYGCYALRDVKEGEVLIEVDYSHILTLSKVQRMPFYRNYQPLSEPVELFYIFITLDTQKESSFWRPYYDILPQSFSSTIGWNEEEIELLKGTNIYSTVKNTNLALLDSYLHAKQFVNNNFPELEFTFERFKWAYQVVMTRCWGFNIDEKKDFELVPFADMLNHDHHIGSLGSYNVSTFSILSKINYTMGDQVYVSYGNKSNEELIGGYGFIIPNNPYNAVEINIQNFNSDDPLISLIFSKLLKNKFHTKVSLKVDPTESNWLAPFRISHMTSADILDVIDVFNNNCSSINIERKAYATASKALLNSLNEYPTTLEDDLERIQDPNLSYIERCALTLTIDAKQLILDHIEFLKKKWLDIFRTGICNGKKLFN